MGGADVLRPYVEAARAQHPSLVDQSHRMDALFGVTNIPSAIWIDESGTIVRPPEFCSPPPAVAPDALAAQPSGGFDQGPAGVPSLVVAGIRARAEDPQRYA